LFGLPACEENTESGGRKNGSLPPYTEVLRTFENERTVLAERYRQSNSDDQRAAVIQQAREAIYNGIRDDILPHWLGTPWGFNGTTRKPGEGKIACGYLVTTALVDAGLDVDRVRLAQLPSEGMIKILTSEAYIKRFSDVSIDDFVEAVQRWGSGVYVVGLDIHTGFIINESDEVRFVHSSYVPPQVVVNENALRSRILGSSRYRVLGKISADDELVVKWLLGTPIRTSS
jgi:hypothetical protein